MIVLWGIIVAVVITVVMILVSPSIQNGRTHQDARMRAQVDYAGAPAGAPGADASKMSGRYYDHPS